MRQKYAIIRDDDQKALVVREYAELDKEMMSLLCEETYSQEQIGIALKEGRQELIKAIRTNNMYPPTAFAYAIAEAIAGLLEEGGNQSAELFFDDKDLFQRADEAVPEEEADEDIDEDVDVDDLLEDEEAIDDDFEDDGVLTDLKSSIKVADEDNSDSDEAV